MSHVLYRLYIEKYSNPFHFFKWNLPIIFQLQVFIDFHRFKDKRFASFHT